MPQSWSTALMLAALVCVPPSTSAAYDKSAFIPPQDQALLVFIQNLRADEKMTFTVFDLNRECIAEVAGREVDIVPTKPGAYTYFVRGYNKTRRIDLDLEAGRTYFIRLYTAERMMTRIPDVELVRRVSATHMQLKFWLDGAFVTHAKDDQCRGKPLQERTKRTQKRINEANADWKTGDDGRRAWYTLQKEDGLIERDIEWL